MVLAVAVLCGCVILMAGCDEGNGSTESSGASTSSEATAATSTSTATGPATGPSTDTSTGEAIETTQPVATTTIVFGEYALWDQTLKYEDVEGEVAVNVTAFLPQDMDDADGMADKGASRLVAMRVRIDNTGESEIDVAPAWFKIKDADGVAYLPIKVTGIDLEALEPDGVKPGGTATGYVFFEMPDEAVITLGVCDVSQGAGSGAVRTWSE
jgi:hypothetical protein